MSRVVLVVWWAGIDDSEREGGREGEGDRETNMYKFK
jgi:hypothetical protein